QGRWIWVGERFLLFRPVTEGDGFVISAEGGVQHCFEQCPLGAEQAVEGWQGDVGSAGYRLQRGRGGAVLDELASGHVNNFEPRGPNLGKPAGVVVSPLDGLCHISDSTPNSVRALLSLICSGEDMSAINEAVAEPFEDPPMTAPPAN